MKQFLFCILLLFACTTFVTHANHDINSCPLLLGCRRRLLRVLFSDETQGNIRNDLLMAAENPMIARHLRAHTDICDTLDDYFMCLPKVLNFKDPCFEIIRSASDVVCGRDFKWAVQEHNSCIWSVTESDGFAKCVHKYEQESPKTNMLFCLSDRKYCQVQKASANFLKCAQHVYKKTCSSEATEALKDFDLKLREVLEGTFLGLLKHPDTCEDRPHRTTPSFTPTPNAEPTDGTPGPHQTTPGFTPTPPREPTDGTFGTHQTTRRFTPTPRTEPTRGTPGPHQTTPNFTPTPPSEPTDGTIGPHQTTRRFTPTPRTEPTRGTPGFTPGFTPTPRTEPTGTPECRMPCRDVLLRKLFSGDAPLISANPQAQTEICTAFHEFWKCRETQVHPQEAGSSIIRVAEKELCGHEFLAAIEANQKCIKESHDHPVFDECVRKYDEDRPNIRKTLCKTPDRHLCKVQETSLCFLKCVKPAYEQACTPDELSALASFTPRMLEVLATVRDFLGDREYCGSHSHGASHPPHTPEPTVPTEEPGCSRQCRRDLLRKLFSGDMPLIAANPQAQVEICEAFHHFQRCVRQKPRDTGTRIILDAKRELCGRNFLWAVAENQGCIIASHENPVFSTCVEEYNRIRPATNSNFCGHTDHEFCKVRESSIHFLKCIKPAYNQGCTPEELSALGAFTPRMLQVLDTIKDLLNDEHACGGSLITTPTPATPGPEPTDPVPTPDPHIPTPGTPGPEPTLPTPGNRSSILLPVLPFVIKADVDPHIPTPGTPGPEPTLPTPDPHIPTPGTPGPEPTLPTPGNRSSILLPVLPFVIKADVDPHIPTPGTPGPEPTLPTPDPHIPTPGTPGPEPTLPTSEPITEPTQVVTTPAPHVPGECGSCKGSFLRQLFKGDHPLLIRNIAEFEKICSAYNQYVKCRDIEGKNCPVFFFISREFEWTCSEAALQGLHTQQECINQAQESQGYKKCVSWYKKEVGQRDQCFKADGQTCKVQNAAFGLWECANEQYWYSCGRQSAELWIRHLSILRQTADAPRFLLKGRNTCLAGHIIKHMGDDDGDDHDHDPDGGSGASKDNSSGKNDDSGDDDHPERNGGNKSSGDDDDSNDSHSGEKDSGEGGPRATKPPTGSGGPFFGKVESLSMRCHAGDSVPRGGCKRENAPKTFTRTCTKAESDINKSMASSILVHVGRGKGLYSTCDVLNGRSKYFPISQAKFAGEMAAYVRCTCYKGPYPEDAQFLAISDNPYQKIECNQVHKLRFVEAKTIKSGYKKTCFYREIEVRLSISCEPNLPLLDYEKTKRNILKFFALGCAAPDCSELEPKH